MSTLVVSPAAEIRGELTVPSDRSIAHRAMLVGAVAQGRTTLRLRGTGEDVDSMIRCLKAYGVGIKRDKDRIRIDGAGLGSWTQPKAKIDCGNSGATMRQLAGLAAHYAYRSVLDGDASLRKRPMERVAKPLRALGAKVETSQDGRPPITVEGGRLIGTDIELEVGSAAVKSSVLLAGLAAEGRTTVTEPSLSRDHTERLLAALDAPIEQERREDGTHRVSVGRFEPSPFAIDVPGDVSAAAFLVAAAGLRGSVQIEGVGLNPTRTGFLRAAKDMGVQVAESASHDEMGEPTGRILAQRSELRAVVIDKAGPEIHDELPLLAVLATQAEGQTMIRGAGELRVKESDRIATIGQALRSLGAQVEELPDGFSITGPTQLRGTAVRSTGDHRIAMALAIAALVAEGETLVEGFECASVSWPGFEGVLASLGVKVQLR